VRRLTLLLAFAFAVGACNGDCSYRFPVVNPAQYVTSVQGAIAEFGPPDQVALVKDYADISRLSARADPQIERLIEDNGAENVWAFRWTRTCGGARREEMVIFTQADKKTILAVRVEQVVS
jgi:hypothetical protein